MPDEADGRPELKEATLCGPEQVCMPQSCPDRKRVEHLAFNEVSTRLADAREVLPAASYLTKRPSFT